jgi:thiol-disulfide isomerase/thioredoxin
MKKYIFILFTVTAWLFSCESKQRESLQDAGLKVGSWRGILKPQGPDLPFLFDVVESGGDLQIILKNADEQIPLTEVNIDGDSIHIPMYIFDATIHACISEDKIQGIYTKNYAEDYDVPFEAYYGETQRFAASTTGELEPFTGKWEVDFINEDGIGKAIGVFEEYKGRLKGTFVRTTGDYRFLEGAVIDDTMKLSAFDGTHLYLFKAVINDDGMLEGEYWSGKTHYQRWTAVKNEAFELPDPYALTYMKEGYDEFNIKFPNASGDLIELEDEQFRNKVVVVQILGTWCPNCMDETKFYVDWIRKNPDKDVAFVGLAFERKADADYAFARINKMKEKLEVPYEVLLAGTTSQESRAEALPMLNKIMSFPTSIVLDRQHQVRQIHTGFSGPGTGEYYLQFVEEFNLLMEKLLSE